VFARQLCGHTAGAQTKLQMCAEPCKEWEGKELACTPSIPLETQVNTAARLCGSQATAPLVHELAARLPHQPTNQAKSTLETWIQVG